MMLKTVYGPPPADEERIEAADLTADLTMESSIQEEEETAAAIPADGKRKNTKGAEGQ